MAAIREKQRSSRNHRVKVLLEQTDKVDFFETPLQEVMQCLFEKHKLNYAFDFPALELFGRGPGAVDHVSMHDICLRHALELILAPSELTYVIREGVVIVTSQEKAESMLTTKIYPVRDLLYAKQPNASMDQLITVITSAVVPESWEEVGGPAAINPFQGVLTISQTDHGHSQINQLLRELRAAVAAYGGPTIPPRTEPSTVLSQTTN